MKDLDTTASLEGLQTSEQRSVLDTIAQLRKCGLESVLSLPQLVVCGDQSAGKSSVLEALTEIPFPRSDNLCTRYATEIILRRATTDSLTIKVIPDDDRPTKEKEGIKGFKASITNFNELPIVMDKATALMGIDKGGSSTSSRAFAKDVLSVEIEGPHRPQLTLVDLPGLIQTETKGVTKADVGLVAEITDHYIKQPRTICLAVISATNDYANQGILTKVREVDFNGERTLGIITKPDKLSAGSGMEKAFLNLACNEDIFFKLGWHVIKNRGFEEASYSFEERNASETAYFRRSNFSKLTKDCVGIDALRNRLSRMLFSHVKQELPKLREDLERAMTESKQQLEAIGHRRATVQDCRAFLVQSSLEIHDMCKAAVEGHYEGGYFNREVDSVFSLESPATIRRLRAVIQHMNIGFSDSLRKHGHKYSIPKFDSNKGSDELDDTLSVKSASDMTTDAETAHQRHQQSRQIADGPIIWSHPDALKWVSQALARTRGKELSGNFNPLLIGELLWEQASKWYLFATDYVDKVAGICSRFLRDLVEEKCPADVQSRLWLHLIGDSLKKRNETAIHELKLIMEDVMSYPINYNHYYTDTIAQRRQTREKKVLATCINNSTQQKKPDGCSGTHVVASVDVNKVIDQYSQRIDPNMEKYSCEEVLDCLFAIYKVNHPTFMVP